MKPKLTRLPPKANYSRADILRFIRKDLLIDANHAEEQAKKEPFAQEGNNTRETLLAYAKECRANMALDDIELTKLYQACLRSY